MPIERESARLALLDITEVISARIESCTERDSERYYLKLERNYWAIVKKKRHYIRNVVVSAHPLMDVFTYISVELYLAILVVFHISPRPVQ